MQQNIDSGAHSLKGLDRYNALTDPVRLTHDVHVEAFKFYETFLASIPDAKFILNTPDKEKWIENFADHNRLFEGLMSVYGYQSEEQVRAHLSADRDNRIEKVVATIPSEQLLLFDTRKAMADARLTAFWGPRHSCMTYCFMRFYSEQTGSSAAKDRPRLNQRSDATSGQVKGRVDGVAAIMSAVAQPRRNSPKC